jgi:PhnB protein
MEPAHPHDHDEIRAVLDDRIAALRAKDAKRFLSSFADRFVTFELAPPLQNTEADVPDAQGLEAWFASFTGPVAYEMRDLRIASGGGVAFCHCLYRISGTRTDGSRTDMWTRQTLGLRKSDGMWKVIHAHASVPFAMDGSNRAEVDLQPDAQVDHAA